MLKSVWFSTAIREGSTLRHAHGGDRDAFSPWRAAAGRRGLTAWDARCFWNANPHGETGALALAQCSVGRRGRQRHGAMS